MKQERSRAPKLAVAALALVLATGCATTRSSHKQWRTAAVTAPAAEKIRWPSEYEPSRATFFVHNEIEIKAPPQLVWDILIQAETWPKWYVGAEDVVVKSSKTGTLETDSLFAWKTMGLRFNSRVKEFEPPSRLAWESRKAIIRGYHAWIFIPTPAGCRVVTDESFRGFLATMQRIFLPEKLHRLHGIFLMKLKEQAEAKAATASLR